MKMVEKIKLNSLFITVSGWEYHPVHHLGEIAYNIKKYKGNTEKFSLPYDRELMIDIDDCQTFCSMYGYGYEKYIETNNDKYFQDAASTVLSIYAFDLGYSGKPFDNKKLLASKDYLELLLKDPFSPVLDSFKKNNKMTESKVDKVWKYLIKHQEEEEKLDIGLKKCLAEMNKTKKSTK
jgi:hypothetical protein